jgi:hypothetical protein
MTWSISIPFRSRSDSLPAVADAARALPEGDDRAVARQIVLGGMRSGVATAGDLLDELDAMSPTERRALLDQARSDVGLPTATAIERGRRHDEQSRVLALASHTAPPLRLVVGPAGWIDLNETEREAERQRIEAERRAVELEQRRAQRLAQLPVLDAERAASARAWTGDTHKTPEGARP